MRPSDTYLDLQSAEDGALGSTPEFLLRCLLGARDEIGRPSNEGGFDEDVNVYLVGLLERFLSAGYHEEVARYLYARDLDLAEDLANNRDDRFHYRVYRVNADHLMLAIGLFRHVEAGGRPHLGPFAREPEEFIGRGGTYYHMASSSLRRLRRRSTGPEMAMQKLGDRFGEYAEILGRVRGSYFHLTSRLGEGQLFHLMREPDGERVPDKAALYDAFLDAYSAWKGDPSEQTRELLRERVEQLREADPDFAFRMPGED